MPVDAVEGYGGPLSLIRSAARPQAGIVEVSESVRGAEASRAARHLQQNHRSAQDRHVHWSRRLHPRSRSMAAGGAPGLTDERWIPATRQFPGGCACASAQRRASRGWRQIACGGMRPETPARPEGSRHGLKTWRSARRGDRPTIRSRGRAALRRTETAATAAAEPGPYLFHRGSQCAMLRPCTLRSVYDFTNVPARRSRTSSVRPSQPNNGA